MGKPAVTTSLGGERPAGSSVFRCPSGNTVVHPPAQGDRLDWEDAGHLLPLEKPQALAGALVDFAKMI